MTCKHIYYVHRGRRLTACSCICRACHNGTECVCASCSHDPEVHIEPEYYNRAQKERLEKHGPPAHTCKECGVEVFRKSNRGRWPLRCLDCR
jgi:hypothetical protein